MSQRVLRLISLAKLLLGVCLIWEGTVDASEPVSCSSYCNYVEWARDADCRNTGLTAVPAACREAELLDLGDNAIVNLPQDSFQGFEALRYLDLGACSLVEISPAAFAGAPWVGSIDLQGNALARLGPGTFEGLSHLHQLFINANSLEAVDSGAFRGLAGLQNLHLSNNSLTDLAGDTFAGLSSLRHLHLHDNQLQELPDGIFDGLANLHTLSLSRNRLNRLQVALFDGLGNLEELWLAFNELVSVEHFPHLPKLQLLDLYHNNLESVGDLLDCQEEQQSKKQRNIKVGSSCGGRMPLQLLLAKNPLVCDCTLEPLRLWLLKEAEHLRQRHRSHATCREPHTEETVSLIDSQTPLCPQPSTDPSTLAVVATTPTITPLPLTSDPWFWVLVLLAGVTVVVSIAVLLGLWVWSRRQSKKNGKSYDMVPSSA